MTTDFEYIQGIRDLEYRILDQTGTMIHYKRISEVADKMVDEIYEQTKNEHIDVVDAIKEIHDKVYQEAYDKGGSDRAKEIFDKLHEFLSETRKEYGFTCMESRSDAVTDFESWLFEQLKEQKNEMP